MKKIPTIFLRDQNDMSRVTREQNSVCAWVFAGEGSATRKYDGTCCLIKEGRFFKRREIRLGKAVPADFVQEDYDDVTGKSVGWVPVDITDKENRWHAEAFDPALPDGTYELLGPKIQGNPEGLDCHKLQSHADAEQMDAPRTFDGLRDWLQGRNIEGLVWHHPDGRMAKIKLRDFGLSRGQK